MRLTQEELAALSAQEKGELLKRQLWYGDVHVEGTQAGRKGYVTIAAADGTVRQVPYTQARTAYYAPGSIRLSKEEIETGQVWGTVPIKPHEVEVEFAQKDVKRRTPNQRLDSMTSRLVNDWRRGMINDGLLKEIAGEYWKAGTPISATRLREVAARLLTQAENEAKATERKRSTERVTR